MRLNWLWPSSAEDRFESWIAQRHQERVLAGATTPAGPCPDEPFLRELARRSRRVLLSDPRIDHAATCPSCMIRLLAFRREIHSRRRKLVLGTAIASCLVFAIVLMAIARYRKQEQLSAENVAVVSRTVNLWDAGTLRGEQPGSLQSVSLPAAPVRLTIILPRFSKPGQYAIAVTRDQTGNGVLAQGRAAAITNGNQEKVSVDLDLRNSQGGSYFLSTTHEQDQASYYYPLQIK
jgi:hypothetical protein